MLDPLRKTLLSSGRALRRFVEETQQARGSDLDTVDPAPLRTVRRQYRQCAGALTLIGHVGPARFLTAMETLAQKLVKQPAHCTVGLVDQLEAWGAVLTRHLEQLLRDSPQPSSALFTAYCELSQAGGNADVHPAELWCCPPMRHALVPAAEVPAQAYDGAMRTRFDGWILKFLKHADPASAAALTQACLRFAAGQQTGPPRLFWMLGAGFFETHAQTEPGEVSAPDVFVKRTASRLFSQYRALSQGESRVDPRLLDELAYFCAHIEPADLARAPVVQQVHAAWGLVLGSASEAAAVRSLEADPDLLRQARKRLATARLLWTAWAEGEAPSARELVGQFSLLGESWLRMDPGHVVLVRAFDALLAALPPQSGASAAALAQEVATVLLGLQLAQGAGQSDGLVPGITPPVADAAQPAGWSVQDSVRWADRLDRIREGQPLRVDAWMQALYWRTTEVQALGSVVAELQAGLREVERGLVLSFQDPWDRAAVQNAPGLLAHSRGVFQVLGMASMALACERIAARIAALLLEEDQAEPLEPQATQSLADSLAALGMLVDCLGYPGMPQAQPDQEDAQLAGWWAAALVESSAHPGSLPRPLLSTGFRLAAEALLHEGLQALLDLSVDLSEPAPLAELESVFSRLQLQAKAAGLAELARMAAGLADLLRHWRSRSAVTTALLHLTEDALKQLQEMLAEHAATQQTASGLARILALTETLRRDSAQAQALGNLLAALGLSAADATRLNIFLNEADAGSRELQEALALWAQAPDAPAPPQIRTAVAGLRAGSASLGFVGLHTLLDAMSRALAALADRGSVSARQVQLLGEAGQAVTRLLHQLAAGLPKAPAPALLAALADLAHQAKAAPDAIRPSA